jgi:hypothetical protein
MEANTPQETPKKAHRNTARVRVVGFLRMAQVWSLADFNAFLHVCRLTIGVL